MMMSNPGEIADAVEQFKKGALLYQHGQFMDDSKLMIAGIKMCRAAADRVDQGPEGRLALLPLLEHTDEHIQAFAATYLYRVAPEKALAVLEYLDKYRYTSAERVAWDMLRAIKRGDPAP
jgi:hypothetical protein